ncbi:hypothetical protein [Granulibacter bethesdensis]|uniref:hypothetical protein n=1 Tax=Granulibacter bethesdensis TaxID=364410 RepID=UPI0004AFBD8D|nr:hypothetical protein [Granulibacter bethesdensis]
MKTSILMRCPTPIRAAALMLSGLVLAALIMIASANHAHDAACGMTTATVACTL